MGGGKQTGHVWREVRYWGGGEEEGGRVGERGLGEQLRRRRLSRWVLLASCEGRFWWTTVNHTVFVVGICVLGSFSCACM